MPRKTRTTWAVALVALVIGALAWVIFALTRPAVVPSLPNPNGYDDFVKAAASISGNIDNLKDLDHDGLRSMISSNAEALRLVRRGLSYRCSFPTAVAITNFGSMIGDLGKLRAVTLLLRAEGRLAELDDHPVAAATNYLEAIRLGIEISRGGFVVNRMIGVAFEAIGGIPLSKLVSRLNCEQARALLPELERLDQNRVAFEEIQHNERQLMVHELLKNSSPLSWPIQWWQVRQINKSTEAKHNATVAHERLLLLELALRCYRCDQGKAAVRLDELIPRYLHQVPQDPFNALSMIYRSQGTNWLLYSVGPDGVDDGGQPAPRAFGTRGVKGDILFDSAW
jgi:hypothetical protein